MIETGNATMPTQPNAVEMPSPIGMANACTIAPTDQILMAHANPFLVPSLSIIRPANNMEIA